MIGHKVLFIEYHYWHGQLPPLIQPDPRLVLFSASLLKQRRVQSKQMEKCYNRMFITSRHTGKLFHWLLCIVLFFRSDGVDRWIWITKLDNKYHVAFIKCVQCPCVGSNRNWNPAESKWKNVRSAIWHLKILII